MAEENMVDFLGIGCGKKIYFHGNAMPADRCLGIP
jgi:hypothetical protein